jgi:hypothetical protein
MVPIPDDPVTPSHPRDPVRFMVHAALALYLSPVILLVCLVGVTSILAGEAVKIARRMARKINRRGDRRRVRIVNKGAPELNTPLAADRSRSRVAR